jgi:pimeloyl-ACP methyl ester carboxylesterase
MSALLTEAQESLHYLTCTVRGLTGSKTISGSRGPIIGVHGWMSGWVDKGLTHYMRTQDIGGILTDFGRQDKSVDQYLESLDQIVTVFPNAIGVGMSMGGLLLQLYELNYPHNSLRGIMLIGAPFGGVEAFNYVQGLGGIYSDLIPTSSFLENLRRREPTKNKPRVNILAHQDFHIGPPTKHQVPFLENIVVQAQGHSDLQNNPRWWSDKLDIMVKNSS